MAKDVLEVRPENSELVEAILAAVDDPAQKRAWRNSLEDGEHLEIRLVRRVPAEGSKETRLEQQRRDGHVPVLNAGSDWIDLANFCELAVKAGYDWEQAKRTFNWLVRTGSVPVDKEECSLRLCVMKFTGNRSSGPHWRLAIRELIRLRSAGIKTPTTQGARGHARGFTPFMQEILEAVQEELSKIRAESD
jgi:hypothetical protein